MSFESVGAWLVAGAIVVLEAMEDYTMTEPPPGDTFEGEEEQAFGNKDTMVGEGEAVEECRTEEEEDSDHTYHDSEEFEAWWSPAKRVGRPPLTWRRNFEHWQMSKRRRSQGMGTILAQ